jgi:hypothetical protein
MFVPFATNEVEQDSLVSHVGKTAVLLVARFWRVRYARPVSRACCARPFAPRRARKLRWLARLLRQLSSAFASAARVRRAYRAG